MSARTFVFALAVMCLGSQTAVARTHQILLYDPDASFGDVRGMVASFSRVLATLGPDWQLQIVEQQRAFEALATKVDAEFAIVTQTYLRGAPAIKLTPLLVPANHGDVYFKKTLYTSVATVNASQLSGKNIATTGARDESDAATHALLSELKTMGIEAPLLVSVPKDVDAIMALYYKQSQGALATANSVEVLRRANPKAVENFHALTETKHILRSPLCALPNATKEDSDALVALFTQLGATPDGKEIMRRLNADSWVRYQPEMMNK